MIVLQSECMSVGVLTKGAELEFIKKNNRNRLWQRSNLWMGQSPILFPIIGGLKDGYYLYNGKKYEMPAHGFAKLMDFSIIEETKSASFVELELQANEETLKKYPFLFKLIVSYQLTDNKLKVGFRVENQDSKVMYFSIGGHPAFCYDKDKSFQDYQIALDVCETALFHFNPSFVDSSKLIAIENGLITDISKRLEENSTICLQGVKECRFFTNSDCIKIRSSMPYLAFWQKKPQNPSFLCLEPWHGLPDYDNTDHHIETKKGIVKLDTLAIFQTSYEIEID